MTWRRLFAIACVCAGLALPAMADDLRSAAQSATACQSVEDASDRLACYDTASLALSEALDADTPATASEPEMHEPTWAAAPRPPEPEDPDDPALDVEEPSQLDLVIVRITVNSIGRHKFYTEDGAVWEQTIIEEVRPPGSLPAIAELKDQRFGNPTLKFDVSNRSYRVRRLE